MYKVAKSVRRQVGITDITISLLLGRHDILRECENSSTSAAFQTIISWVIVRYNS